MTVTADVYVPAGRRARLVVEPGTSGAAEVLTPKGWVRTASVGSGEGEVPRSLVVSRVRAVRTAGDGAVTLEVL